MHESASELNICYATAMDAETLCDSLEKLIYTLEPNGSHTVAAIAICEDGSAMHGMYVHSRSSIICAESVAVGNALLAAKQISMIGAMYLTDNGEAKIISPCGACRERIHFVAPESLVLIVKDGPQLVSISELFPLGDIN